MMTISDPWADRLSEYIDGDLDEESRQALEAHLATCATCRLTRDTLVRVVARARRSEYRQPAHDLWPRVEHALRPVGRRARQPFVIAFTLGRLAAAAGFVAVVAGGLAWTIASRRAVSGPPVVVSSDPVRDPVAPVSTGVGLGPTAAAVASYRQAANDLERALEAGRGTLRPETMQIIETNLRAMDIAIAQADSALQRDPGSEYLNQYLVATMHRKLKLLRHALAITSPRT